MPIKFDKEPNSMRKYQRRRDGTLTSEYKPDPAPVIVPPPTMRIRMLKAVRSRVGTFAVGQAAELPVELARWWIEAGLAEEDKMLDSAPETKSHGG
jgi:hypothetical protein